MRRKQLKRKLGQNTAEYLIMLVLVAVGSIGVFTVFGDTVKKQLSNVVSAMTGSDSTVQDLAKNATDAKTRSTNANSMSGINKDEISYGKK